MRNSAARRLNDDGGRLCGGGLVRFRNRASGVLSAGSGASGKRLDRHRPIRRHHAFLMRPGRVAGDRRRGENAERDRRAQRAQRANRATGLTSKHGVMRLKTYARYWHQTVAGEVVKVACTCRHAICPSPGI